MDKNSLVMIIIVAVLVGALGFFGGTWYQKNQQGSLPGGMGQEFPGGTDSSGGMRGPAGGMGGGMINGEITDANDESITVKDQDGNSTIVFISDSTTINKTSEGSVSDLAVGTEVMVVGSDASDGTITAQTISIGGGQPPGGMPNESNQSE